MSNLTSHRLLVTGALGQIGSELVPELRKKYGKENVIAAGHSKPPSKKFLASGPFVFLDATDMSALQTTVENHRVDTIYHLAGILSAVGEKDPQLAWHVNIDSLHNVLEISRNHNLRIFWPSSIAVFGAGVPRANTPQESPLIPGTMYGVTKVAGELLCNYFYSHYSVDVRSLRYPGIISSETPPGGGTTDYAVEMFYEAIRKKKYTCFVRKDTVLPMLYMPDCINATLKLMEAKSDRIKVRTSYNLTGTSFSAEELASEIKEHIPQFSCEYKPDFRQKIADSWPMSLNDSPARMEWGWKPEFDLYSMTKDMIEKLSKRL